MKKFKRASRSDHKHEYEKILVRHMLTIGEKHFFYFYLYDRCTICGKITGGIDASHENIKNATGYIMSSHIPDKKVLEIYKDLKLFDGRDRKHKENWKEIKR